MATPSTITDMVKQTSGKVVENGNAVAITTGPKRKKARRACLPCQRAHLTCADERPCTRCVKRGMADKCRDGVRKKDKYHIQFNNNVNNVNNNENNTAPLAAIPKAFPPISSLRSRNELLPSYPVFTTQTIPPLLSQQPDGVQNSYGYPTLFDFDSERSNFHNHYGAPEFSMLGHGSILSQAMGDSSFNWVSEAEIAQLRSKAAEAETEIAQLRSKAAEAETEIAQLRSKATEAEIKTTEAEMEIIYQDGWSIAAAHRTGKEGFEKWGFAKGTNGDEINGEEWDLQKGQMEMKSTARNTDFQITQTNSTIPI